MGKHLNVWVIEGDLGLVNAILRCHLPTGHLGDDATFASDGLCRRGATVSLDAGGAAQQCIHEGNSNACRTNATVHNRQQNEREVGSKEPAVAG